jgi:hypothetical protein
VLFQEFSGGIQKIVKPFPVRIVVFQTEVWARDFQDEVTTHPWISVVGGESCGVMEQILRDREISCCGFRLQFIFILSCK